MAYTTSNEYEKIIYSGESTGNRIRIWFNEVELEDADNYCEKLSASSRLLPSSSSNRFSLDNFVSKELTLILHEVSLDRIVDQVKISLGTLVNGEYEDIPLGVFNIQDKPITDKDKITIKLRDNAIKFDFNYNAKPIIDSNGGSATKLQIFEDICSKAGVNTKVASFANSSDLIGIYDNTIKARAYIYYLAEQCGAIPTIDREGELIFVYINNLEVQRIPLSSIEKFEIGNKYKISKVIYEDAIRKYQSGNDNYDKLFLNSANPYISNQNQVNSIGSVVNGFEIDSLKTGKVLGNPAIDPYDIIEIYDDENNEELIIARTLANYSLTYNGVITNIYDTQIGLEARKENVSITSEPTFKKWATTEINNLDASIKLSAGKISTLEEKTNPTGQASGSNIHISDSADAELLDFKLYGKSTQETRTENLFDNTWEQGAINSTTGNTGNDTSSIRTANFIRIYPNYLYEFSRTISTSYMVFRFYDINKNYLGYQTTEGMMTSSVSGNRMIAEQNSMTFTITNIDVAYMKIADASNDLTTIYTLTTNCPSPDYPSEIKSVGYTNLFCGYDNMLVGFLPASGSYPTTNTTYPNTRYQLIELNAGESVTTLLLGSDNGKGRIRCIDKATNQVIGSIKTTTNNYYDSKVNYDNGFVNGTITAKQDIILGIMLLNNADLQFQITRGTQQHNNYIPFGKYGVEVNITKGNLYNVNDRFDFEDIVNVDEDGWINVTYDNTNGTSTRYYDFKTNFSNLVKPNTQYDLFIEIKNVSGTGTVNFVSSQNICQFATYSGNGFAKLSVGTIKPTIKTKSDFTGCTNLLNSYGTFKAGESGSITFRMSLVEKDTMTTENFVYKPYTLTPTLIQADYPLMSNKDETIRDCLYLQNGNLYLKKYINEIVLNGSETTWVENSATKGLFQITLSNVINDLTNINAISNCLIGIKGNIITMSNNYVNNSVATYTNNRLFFRINEYANNLSGLKEWLSNNNVKVQYQLAEPQDILIAENVESLITYKNVTNISTTDNLQPNMEVVYVKDNTLNDIYQTQNDMNKYYTKVENDAQLEIVSDEIKSSVTEINTTIDTIRGAIETINQTMLTQTADQFEMLFKQTGIKEIVDSVDKLTKSNNATLVEQEQWIRFKGGNIELGRSDSQVKLLLSNDKILFMTGGNESAYISNNQLYITDSTILNKLQVGHWETKEENGNLNTRWIEGVI